MQHIFDPIKLPHCSSSQSKFPRPQALASLEHISYVNYQAPSDLQDPKLCGGTQQSKV